MEVTLSNKFSLGNVDAIMYVCKPFFKIMILSTNSIYCNKTPNWGNKKENEKTYIFSKCCLIRCSNINIAIQDQWHDESTVKAK